MRNSYGSIKLVFFHIVMPIFGLSLLHSYKLIAFNLLCLIFGISPLLLSLISLSKVIALPTIAIAIVVPLFFLKGDSEKIFQA